MIVEDFVLLRDYMVDFILFFYYLSWVVLGNLIVSE